jgi:hypothetical protein
LVGKNTGEPSSPFLPAAHRDRSLPVLPPSASDILVIGFLEKLQTERKIFMLETKDFATCCLSIVLCAILIPLFFLVFKLTLVLAVFLAIVTAIILGITVLGRIVRFFITGK